jgi:hypothetical protein
VRPPDRWQVAGRRKGAPTFRRAGSVRKETYTPRVKMTRTGQSCREASSVTDATRVQSLPLDIALEPLVDCSSMKFYCRSQGPAFFLQGGIARNEIDTASHGGSM